MCIRDRVGISLIVLIFLFVNCYKRDSVPNIPDYTETSLIDQLFSRAFRKYQSFLLPKMHHRSDKSPNPIHNPSHQYHHGPIVNPYPFEDDPLEYKQISDGYEAKNCENHQHNSTSEINQPTEASAIINNNSLSCANQTRLSPTASTLNNTPDPLVKGQYCHYQGPIRIVEPTKESSLPVDLSAQYSLFLDQEPDASSRLNLVHDYPPIKYFDSIIVYCPDKDSVGISNKFSSIT